MPCRDLKLSLMERDSFSEFDKILWSPDDRSNEITFNCNEMGYQGQVININGANPDRGAYQMVVYVTRDEGMNFRQDEGTYNVHSPMDDTTQARLTDEYMYKTSDKAVKFESLINVFNTNDFASNTNWNLGAGYVGDEIDLYIFSDIIGRMFKCGTF